MTNFLMELTEIFKSEKKSISNIEPILNRLRHQIPLTLEKYYNILISVTEAINNAIIHGNRLDLNKDVKFELKADSNKIIITVTDEGSGFNPDELLDPTQPDNLLKENGRGVFLIKQLCDEVTIKSTSKGTKVIMVFYINFYNPNDLQEKKPDK